MAVPKIWRKIPEYYNLLGRRCSLCKELFFPPRDVCTKCGSTELLDHYFIGKGKVVTYTVIRTPVSDPEGENSEVASRDIPYILALIGLEEGPMLTSQVVDCPIEDMKIGMEVEVVFRKISEKGEKGVIQYGYKFRPVK